MICDKLWVGSITPSQTMYSLISSGVLLSCSQDIAGVPREPGDEAMIQPTIGRVYALSL